MRSQTCSLLESIWDYFLVPTIAVIVFVFVTTPPFNDWLTSTVPNHYYQLYVGALLIFVTVYLTTRWHDSDEYHCI